MAPLPENNTNRFWVDYTTKGQAHSLLFRGKPGVLVGELHDIAEAVFNSISDFWHISSSTVGARYSSQGSDFSLPVSFSFIEGTFGAAQNDATLPNFLGIHGRGMSTGREVNYRIFGTNLVPDATFRVEPPIGLQLDSLRDIFVSSAPQLCTIGGDTPVFKEYINLGVDAYYQRKRRTG